MEPYLYREFELVIEFCDKEIVRQLFTGFHYSNNGCINLILAVLENALLGVCLFLLLQRKIPKRKVINTLILLMKDWEGKFASLTVSLSCT